MKKLLALLVAVGFMFGTIGCTDTKKTTSGKPPADGTSKTKEPKKPPEEKKPEEKKPEEKKPEEKKPEEKKPEEKKPEEKKKDKS